MTSIEPSATARALLPFTPADLVGLPPALALVRAQPARYAAGEPLANVVAVGAG
ncbi:hypothetical protein [Streptomyces poriticola]|uniref:hypothetical protein n=1 Tax=Streptomyces poriticola TaxID=3120506 RepID=UPI002FCE4232